MDQLTKDSVVCIDYETLELRPDGSTVASTEFYRAEFRVDSCAFSWYDDNRQFQCVFTRGEDETRRVLSRLSDIGCRLICHNYQFELGVSKCRFPNAKLNWYADTMRMAQNYDNGGDPFAFELIYVPGDDQTEDDAKKAPLSGLGLVKCAKRILNLPDHKAEAHGWLQKNVPGIKKGKEGAYLNKLPDDILKRYNEADVKVTLDLYEFLEVDFVAKDFDWRVDHQLFMHSVSRLVDSQIRGIKINVEQLTEYDQELQNEIANIGSKFLIDNAEYIKVIEQKKIYDVVQSKKSIKGKINIIQKILDASAFYETHIRFNPGSNAQLQDLFVNHRKISPIFFTKKGSPSFKSNHLHQWSEQGLSLAKRRKRLLVQAQARALLEKTAYDGKYHVQLRACGTVTGRYTGTGGVNIQALARRDEKLMSALLPESGYVFVSTDMSAGEPSIISQYTKDAKYKYFCFDGVGKRPYYDGSLLMIDDIYLAYASVCPIFSADIRRITEEYTYNGLSFYEAWVQNPDLIKEDKRVKSIRKNSKWICLGFGYGLGGKSLYNKAIEAGLNVTPKQCKDAFLTYWDLFEGIRAYAKNLEQYVTEHKWFNNPFGYRFVPTEPRKAFNGMVQSSVSSLFHWFGILMSHYCAEALYIVTIHDEDIYMVPEHGVKHYHSALKQVTDHINKELKWDVDLRFGAKDGRNLFEAK